VLTCGKDDEETKEYTKHQRQEDKRLDQLNLFKKTTPQQICGVVF